MPKHFDPDSSVIVVGIHPHSLSVLHQPGENRNWASLNLFGVLNAEQITEEVARFFGVTIDARTLDKLMREASQYGTRPSYSVAIEGKKVGAEKVAETVG